MSAREDRETGESSRRQLQGLPVIRRNVAGVDLGSERHWVCAPTQDGSGREIASFGATTLELLRLAEWLKQRQVESVAMESTDVYWIAPHEVLEAQGLEVLLVDTRQLARVPGRDKKTDPTDCEWIQRLHSCGLLRGSFRPQEQICMLRTLVRDKASLVAESADWLRRMQKSLDQMNVRVHRAVSDLEGATGMAILRAIAGGECDARKLAKSRDARCSQTEQEILRKLHEMEQGEPPELTAPPLQNANKARAIKKRGQEAKRQALYRMSGVDVTQIDAIGVETVEVVVSEYGSDLSRFPTEKQFVSHATLAPRVPKSGGKPVRKKKRNSASTRVAAALRMAALSLRHSQTALGAYYRRIAQRRGGDIAGFAAARKLATLIYRLLRWGQPYVDEGAAAFETRYRQHRIGRLAATAKELGYQLTPVSA